MKNEKYLSMWVRRFLTEYLIGSKNLSVNTLMSYRDTLRLIIPYVAIKNNKSIDKLLLDDLNVDRIKSFLTSIETERGCSLSTRNLRLAAIHAFARFVSANNIDYMDWCRLIRMISFKKAPQKLITYLDKVEMNVLLDVPDKKTKQGLRDYTLLLLLYNTGARADEVAHMKISDLSLPQRKSGIATITIKGKGNKQRRCPLWEQTVNQLRELIQNREPSETVFINRQKQSMTRFGIYAVVDKYARIASGKLPSIAEKRVSPHTIRHTTATHLLQSGVDINTIRAWLGHVSINTTNIYAEVDLDMKARALNTCEVETDEKATSWKDDRDLMAFLNGL